MKNNGWLKLAVFSFVGIIIAVVILGFTANSSANMAGHNGMQTTGMTMTGTGNGYTMNTPMGNMQVQGNMGMNGAYGMNGYGMNGYGMNNMGNMGYQTDYNTMMQQQLNQMQQQMNQMQQAMMNSGMYGMQWMPQNSMGGSGGMSGMGGSGGMSGMGGSGGMSGMGGSGGMGMMGNMGGMGMMGMGGSGGSMSGMPSSSGGTSSSSGGGMGMM